MRAIYVVPALALVVACGNPEDEGQRPEVVRIATFNASPSRSAKGQLIADLSTPYDPQARTVG
jgi:hypothetical protein